MVKLQRLFLSGTSLSGEIPLAIGSLPSLVSLDLSDTLLSGSVEIFRDMPKLRAIWLSNLENLTGPVSAFAT